MSDDYITIKRRDDGKYTYVANLPSGKTACGTGYITPESALQAGERWFS